MHDLIMSGRIFLFFALLAVIAAVIGIFFEKRKPPAEVVLSTMPLFVIPLTTWAFMTTHFHNGVVSVLIYVAEFALFQFVMKPLLRRYC